MKVAFFEVRSWEEAILENYAAKLGADIYRQPLEEIISLASHYEIISTFIYSQLSAKVLKKLPHLKMIATRSTGYDHIDLNYCRQHKIAVSNVPSYGENTVAEHAFGLILALSRHLLAANQRVRQGGFSPAGLTGFDLRGKTLGVIGVGHIGQHMVRYGRAFGMHVLGVTRRPHPHLERRLGYRRVNLETCLRESKIVSIHLPLTRGTYHLINRQNIRWCQPGCYLINTARGPIVESEAILWALNENILGGAGLDVLEEEEIIANAEALFDQYLSREHLAELVTAHLLREHPRVIITPHNAFNTREAIDRIISTTIKNIKAFSSGKKLNRVDI